jgi:hypothetical protein
MNLFVQKLRNNLSCVQTWVKPHEMNNTFTDENISDNYRQYYLSTKNP